MRHDTKSNHRRLRHRWRGRVARVLLNGWNVSVFDPEAETERKKIDAHIADHLLEAVWREGVWLIEDGICSTEELDEAVRMSFGLRWAQMGLFETYRIAGGEVGMKPACQTPRPMICRSRWTVSCRKAEPTITAM